MEPTSETTNMQMDRAFPLQEVRSYVSDSAESCYSPGAHLSQSFEGILFTTLFPSLPIKMQFIALP